LVPLAALSLFCPPRHASRPVSSSPASLILHSTAPAKSIPFLLQLISARTTTQPRSVRALCQRLHVIQDSPLKPDSCGSATTCLTADGASSLASHVSATGAIRSAISPASALAQKCRCTCVTT
jgi:hypothetical protein